MEVLVSTAVMGIVLVAVGSATLIASRALPDEDDPSQSILAASRKLDFIASELSTATAVSELGARAVTFTVPDRTTDGDSNPEKIRYAWAGTAGDPITRQYNSGAVAVFMENVHHFAIAGDLKEVAAEGGTPREGPEALLISRSSSDGTRTHCEVRPTHAPGMFFRPQLSGAATGWRVTRVRFQAKRVNVADGTTTVLVCSVDANGFPRAVIDWGTLDERDLTLAYTWREFSFFAMPVMPPENGLALLLMHGGGGSSAWIHYRTGGTDTPDAHYVGTTDGGGSWNVNTNMDMVFEVYGKVTSTDAGVTRYLKSARISLQAGTDSAGYVQTGFLVHNRPEVP